MNDTIRSLIRFVARGFYSKQYILILDAILLHSVLSEDDLYYLLGINPKQLRALCYKLVDDRLLVNHVQKEENNQQRLTTRTYYYIHITEAIDSIKWKVHSIVNELKEEMSRLGNPNGYVCLRCGKKVSQLDAISLLSDDKLNFICDNCNNVLVEDDSSQQASIRQARLEKLMTQIEPIISYLKKIDDTYIEDNNFENALTIAIPARTSSSASYTISNRISTRSRSNLSSSLQNAASKSQATLNVSITANDENYEREQLEKERVRTKLEQNALPSWHSGSTVGKSTLGKLNELDDNVSNENSKESTPQIKSEVDNESMNVSDSATPQITNENDIIKSEPEQPQIEIEPKINIPTGVSNDNDKDKEAQDVLAAYYADLAEREAQEDEEDEEDDDDDFDEFEDI